MLDDDGRALIHLYVRSSDQLPDVDLAPFEATLRDIWTRLQNTYCRSIGVQFFHVDQGQFWSQMRGAVTRQIPLAQSPAPAQHCWAADGAR